jgi:hypothetical protein
MIWLEGILTQEFLSKPSRVHLKYTDLMCKLPSTCSFTDVNMMKSDLDPGYPISFFFFFFFLKKKRNSYLKRIKVYRGKPLLVRENKAKIIKINRLASIKFKKRTEM